MTSAGPFHTPGPAPGERSRAASSLFTGRVVVVTGAGSGIGRAAALAFAAAGAAVVLVGRRHGALEATAEDACRSDVVVAPCDVTRPEQVDELFDTVGSRFGVIDAAFNAAGTFGRFVALHEDTDDNFESVVGTNLRGLWLCMRHELAAMVQTGGGAIVNCASIAGHRGHQGSALYAATKHAVVGLSRSAALQYAQHGIRVNVVSPGSTDTGMLRSIYQTTEQLRARAERSPMQRLGTAEEVAAAAVWLASSAASYVTGQTIVVDGGVVAGAVG